MMMHLINQLNVFDYIVAFIILVSAAFGFWRGFTREFIALTAWVLAVLAAILLTPKLSLYLQRFIHSELIAHITGFISILLVVLFLGVFINMVISRLTTGTGIGLINRPLGALFGLARGVIIAALLVLIIGRTSMHGAFWYEHSTSAYYLEQVNHQVEAQYHKEN